MNRGETKQRFLHIAEVSILKSLRRMELARFSELMAPTGLTSDSFKFYLRDLVKIGWVEKTPVGLYMLTPSGKELANNLDETRQTIQKQPKLSVLIVASRQNAAGETEYLFQQRLRHPYYGFWGCLSGPVQWGQSPEQTAEAELYKQTGLRATCIVRSFCRTADYDTGGTLLEDKLFAIAVAEDVKGALETSWGGGINEWMTVDTLSRQPKFFPLSAEMIELAEDVRPYASFVRHYTPSDY